MTVIVRSAKTGSTLDRANYRDDKRLQLSASDEPAVDWKSGERGERFLLLLLLLVVCAYVCVRVFVLLPWTIKIFVFQTVGVTVDCTGVQRFVRGTLSHVWAPALRSSKVREKTRFGVDFLTRRRLPYDPSRFRDAG